MDLRVHAILILVVCAWHTWTAGIIPLTYMTSASFMSWADSSRLASTPPDVIKRVLELLSLQAAAEVLIPCPNFTPSATLLELLYRLVTAAFVLDTVQYWGHRSLHSIPLLYKHVHRTHHKFPIPIPWAALYNSFYESIMLDMSSFAIAQWVAGLSSGESVLLGILATLKTVSDHGCYSVPFLSNNAEFHRAHHLRLRGNFEQPFFTVWDDLMGTRL